MQVLYGDKSIFDFKFDRLPRPSFLEGVDGIYFLGELTTSDGTVVRSETGETRRFLYAVDVSIDEAEFPGLRIVAEDFSGNTTSIEITVP